MASRETGGRFNTWNIFYINVSSKLYNGYFVINLTEQRPDKLTVEDLKELRYLECVIKVSLSLLYLQFAKQINWPTWKPWYQFCCRVNLFNKLTVSLKESQRLFPSVPLIARTTSEDCQLGMLLLFYVSYLFIPTYLLFYSLVRVLMHVFTTSAFDVEVRLFSNRSQTSKCGKNISCTLEYRLMCNCRRSCNISTSTVWSFSEQTHGNMESIFNLTFLAGRLCSYAWLCVDTGRNCIFENGNKVKVNVQSPL